jgi:PPOX class probable F420-dependent enzyme
VAVSLTDEEIALLQSSRVGHLATVDAHGQPHVVPVCYAWLDGALYTPIDEKPKRRTGGHLQRVRNIEDNPRVCLTVDRYDEDWSSLAWVQVRATAVVLESGNSRPAAIAALRIRYPQYRDMTLESQPLIQLTPTSIRSWHAT